jgi:hypothetical protein
VTCDRFFFAADREKPGGGGRRERGGVFLYNLVYSISPLHFKPKSLLPVQ